MRGGDRLHLKPGVVLQPLVDRWYAWSHLVPPCTLALNHLDRHLRVMDSYVAAPEAHAAALTDPAMAGGPFVDVPVERAGEVAALAAGIRHRRAGLLELGEAVRELHTLLSEKATGFSLDAFYEQVPLPLRGMVELGYDLANQPTFRLSEPLLYAGEHYDPSAQGFALFEMDGDDRPFVLATPSLDQEGRAHLDIPFASGDVDALARLRWEPRSRGELAEAFGAGSPLLERADTLLTTEAPPPPPPPYAGPGLRWRYFNHASVLVEAGGVSVLTDPLIPYAHGGSLPRYTFHDLPEKIDCLLITHGHQDHLVLETLLQLRHRAQAVAVPRCGGGSLQDPSLKLLLERVGFTNVVEVQELDEIDLGPLRVRVLPFMGEHADLDIRAKATYLVETAGGHRAWFGADTRNLEPALFQRVHDLVGDVHSVFLGMECDGAPLDWLYGPLLLAPHTRESWRMAQDRRLSGSDCAEAVETVRALGARHAYVYSMGQEPWLRYLLSLQYTAESRPLVESNKLIDWCRAAGLAADRLYAQREAHIL